MGSRCYDGAVDMWAVGCVLAELLAGQVKTKLNLLYHCTKPLGMWAVGWGLGGAARGAGRIH
jgi:hypothetical protein